MDSSIKLQWPAGLGLLCLFAAGYLLYSALLPKPIPGIPYNHHAAKRFLGDVPDALRYHKQTSELYSFITSQFTKLQSPIIQLFMRPTGRPWVIVTDFREAQDIMTRRTREFDRSSFFGDLFAASMPGNMVHMPTGNDWRAHRRLMADTMSTFFLNEVAAPQIYDKASDTIRLWHIKARLADGRPFAAVEDIYRGALDIIWAAAFGSEVGVIKSQVKLLSNLTQIDLPSGTDQAVTFPQAKTPEAFEALMTVSESTEIPANSPVPRLHHRFALRFYPKLVAARKAKDRLITERINAAWKKFASGEVKEDEVKSALDLIMHREALMAKKEGRPAAHDTQTIRDELLGFLIAGHETTSTTISWGLKFLTTNQEVQQKLRSAIQTECKRAHDAGSTPTAEEIIKCNLPYLDATIEEMHRCGNTASANIRRATEDTEVLGHRIPKGTDVFLMSNGPAYISQAFQVDESKRSQSSQDSKDRIGVWNSNDIGLFMPERWLVQDEKGSLVFDSHAGPAHHFGAGPRMCFGRKLANIELKVILALIIWNFELLPTPAHLSSYRAKDTITHQPQQCYLRLAEAK